MNSSAQPQPTAGGLQTGARVALLGLVINIALAIIKIVAGLLGNAYVLIADGIESALDVGGSVIIWGALKFAARPPDATHPYGHGKAEPFAAIVVSVGVLAAALGLAISSVRELFLPRHGPAPFALRVMDPNRVGMKRKVDRPRVTMPSSVSVSGFLSAVLSK